MGMSSRRPATPNVTTDSTATVGTTTSLRIPLTSTWCSFAPGLPKSPACARQMMLVVPSPVAPLRQLDPRRHALYLIAWAHVPARVSGSPADPLRSGVAGGVGVAGRRLGFCHAGI